MNSHCQGICLRGASRRPRFNAASEAVIVHQQQDSDAQNAIRSVTDRFFASESEVHHFAVFEGGPPPPRGSVRRVASSSAPCSIHIWLTRLAACPPHSESYALWQSHWVTGEAYSHNINNTHKIDACLFLTCGFLLYIDSCTNFVRGFQGLEVTL